jgi:hypothetical protein
VRALVEGGETWEGVMRRLKVVGKNEEEE